VATACRVLSVVVAHGVVVAFATLALLAVRA